MKFYLLSDLHLEFTPYSFPKIEEGATLILAGDIGNLQTRETTNQLIQFLTEACSLFKYVIHIPGNHEYYFSSLQMFPELINRIKIDHSLDNYFFLNKDCMSLDEDVVVIGATLWTDFQPLEDASPRITHDFLMKHANQFMNDYRAIAFCDDPIPSNATIDESFIRKYERRTISSDDILQVHKEHLQFIEENVIKYNKLGRKTIVLTHHAPSSKSISPKFQGNDFNPFFVNTLDNLVSAINPTIWVHGHVHSHHDYMLGNTRVLCNARGYPQENVYDFINGFNFDI